jgi:hypothetical protein
MKQETINVLDNVEISISNQNTTNDFQQQQQPKYQEQPLLNQSFYWFFITSDNHPSILIPYFIRKNGFKYVSLRMINSSLLEYYDHIEYFKLYSSNLKESQICTESEARLLNEINNMHLEKRFGNEPFKENDFLIDLEHFHLFHDILKLKCKLKKDKIVVHSIQATKKQNQVTEMPLVEKIAPFVPKQQQQIIIRNQYPIQFNHHYHQQRQQIPFQSSFNNYQFNPASLNIFNQNYQYNNYQISAPPPPQPQMYNPNYINIINQNPIQFNRPINQFIPVYSNNNNTPINRFVFNPCSQPVIFNTCTQPAPLPYQLSNPFMMHPYPYPYHQQQQQANNIVRPHQNICFNNNPSIHIQQVRPDLSNYFNNSPLQVNPNHNLKEKIIPNNNDKTNLDTVTKQQHLQENYSLTPSTTPPASCVNDRLNSTESLFSSIDLSEMNKIKNDLNENSIPVQCENLIESFDSDNEKESKEINNKKEADKTVIVTDTNIENIESDFDNCKKDELKSIDSNKDINESLNSDQNIEFNFENNKISEKVISLPENSVESKTNKKKRKLNKSQDTKPSKKSKINQNSSSDFNEDFYFKKYSIIECFINLIADDSR